MVALDAERARRAAVAADEATARGERAGPLHGLPMTVKDVWETEGLTTTSGAPELAAHVPATDALAVGRLKAAGAIVFGKTNTPLYAGDFQTYNDLFGTTNNPWDTSRTAGGSSGGAAAAVAAGLTPLELGSDIGGSIRNPAHYNGVFGLKPSWGVIPSRGHIPGPPGTLVEADVNCAGPIARGLADLRTALCAMAGPLPEDAPAWRLELETGPPVDGVGGIRVATVFDEGTALLPLATDVRSSLVGFAERLAAAGASVEAVALPVPLAEGLESWQELVLPMEGTKLSDEDFAAFCAVEDVDGDDMVVRAGRALVARHRSWLAANERRQHQRAAWATLFERLRRWCWRRSCPPPPSPTTSSGPSSSASSTWTAPPCPTCWPWPGAGPSARCSSRSSPCRRGSPRRGCRSASRWSAPSSRTSASSGCASCWWRRPAPATSPRRDRSARERAGRRGSGGSRGHSRCRGPGARTR